MSVHTVVHINFSGEARHALEFYNTVFGGEMMAATYADINAVEDAAKADQIAFGRVTAPNGFDIMAYDVQPSKKFDRGENPFYVMLQGSDAEETESGWKALAAGGTVLIPLGPAPFAPLYGMLTDRFGVTWIVGMMGDA